MAGTSGGPLTPEQRTRMQQAITDELRRAWNEAVAAGVPAERLAAVVEERRREILSALAGVDDRQHGGDDPADDDGVAH